MTAAHPESPLTLYSTLAVKGALDRTVLPLFLAGEGRQLETVFAPTAVILDRIANGSRPDVVVATTKGLNELAALSIIDAESVQPIAEVGVGVAVASGDPHPDIGNKDGLVTALLSARSVAYSRSGASGQYFAGLLATLGITAPVNASATILDQGFTAEAVVDGRADLAIQQLSELALVEGVDIVGPLPAAVQHTTQFAVGTVNTEVLRRDLHPDTARLVSLLTSVDAVEAYLAAGLDVLSTR